VVTFLAGGIAYAAIPDSGGLIHGCYQNNKGTLRVVDSTTPGCSIGETSLSWNQTGPQGLQGPQGTQGPVGPSGLSHGYSTSDEATVDSSDLAASPSFVQAAAVDALPAGNYLVAATAFLDFDPCQLCLDPPRLLCHVLANGGILVGYPLMSPVAIGGNSSDKAVVPFTTSVSFANDGNKVELDCASSRDNTTVTGYLDLTAVNSLN
jgi:hypothetical protein